MIASIQFSVKEGFQIELKTVSKLSRARCIEHAIDAALSIGWSLEAKANSETRVVAAAPHEPVIDQLVSLFMMRGARPTYFDFVVKNQQECSELYLTVFVTQPRPGKADRFIETLYLVGNHLAREFAKDEAVLRWRRSDFGSFQRVMEDAAKRGLPAAQMLEAAERHVATEFIF